MENCKSEGREGAQSIEALRLLLSSPTSVSEEFSIAATAVLNKIISFRQLSLPAYKALPKSGTMRSLSAALQDFGKQLTLSNQQAIVLRCLTLEMVDCANDTVPLRTPVIKQDPVFSTKTTIKAKRRMS